MTTSDISTRSYSNTSKRPSPNDSYDSLAHGPNTRSSDKSNFASRESALHLSDQHQVTATPGPSKDPVTRCQNNKTGTQSAILPSPAIRRIELPAPGIAKEIECPGPSAAHPRIKQSSMRLQPTVPDVPDEDETAADNATGPDDDTTALPSIVSPVQDVQTPQTERADCHSQKITDSDCGDNERSDYDDESLFAESFGDLDVESAVDEANNFLQDTSPSKNGSVSYEHHSTDSGRNSEDQNSEPRTPPETSNLLTVPNGVVDTSQLPLSPESFQANCKRKFSPVVESESDQSSRNLRPRVESNNLSFCPRDDLCTSSPSLKRNDYAVEACHQHPITPPAKNSPHKPIRDRWNGRFSSHTALSDLSSAAKNEIESMCDQILRPDFSAFMDKHLPVWISDAFYDSPSPEAKPRIDRHYVQSHDVWKYVNAISAEDETNYLKSRFAHVRLYLLYIEEFDRQKKAGHPDLTAKTKAIDIICDSGSLPQKTAAKIRQQFHGRKVIGERWWWCGQFLGLGFFLLCSEKSGKKMLGFYVQPLFLLITDESAEITKHSP